MSQHSGFGNERTLADLTAELESLRSEASGIGNDILRTLEGRWFGFQSVLFPKLLDWGRTWEVGTLASFSLALGVLQFQPALSLNVQAGGPDAETLGGSLAFLDERMGAGAESLLRRSLASREFELDFVTPRGALPFSLFDDVVGVFFVTFAGETVKVTPSVHRGLTDSAERLLESLRREILAGRLLEVKRALSQVG